MAKKYIVTASPGVVPTEGYHAGGGVFLYELEENVLAGLQEKYPSAFDVVDKKEYDEGKKKILSSGSVIESASTPPLNAPPAEEEAKVEEEDVLKVSKVKAPEAPKKKKGKS
jgi:hypothetical protein